MKTDPKDKEKIEVKNLLNPKNIKLVLLKDECLKIIYQALPRNCLRKEPGVFALETDQVLYLAEFQNEEAKLTADQICQRCIIDECTARIQLLTHYLH